MGRAPCCEKMGMKKGPWTPEEDQILVSYVQQFGHGNWRALPKQARLLRCGKSCRLRWMNYLRPDIKRGNFTRDEEETIIKLHQVIGNRWSAIASKLPGRTDNEIKNVWNTHLKKKLQFGDTRSNSRPFKSLEVSKKESEPENGSDLPVSPQYSTVTTDMSTATTTTATATTIEMTSNNDYFPELPSEDFWTHMLSNNVAFSTPIESGFELKPLYPMDWALDYDALATHGHGDGDGRDFWCNPFSKIGEFPELLEM